MYIPRHGIITIIKIIQLDILHHTATVQRH